MNALTVSLTLLALSWGTSTDASGGPKGTSTHHVNVGSASLSYVERGHGIPVVFVHGEISDLRAWAPQLRAAPPDYRFLAYSQRHVTHDSANPEERHSIDTDVADLVALLRHVSAGPAILVGHSYGGAVAVRAALRQPALVRGVFVHEPWLELRSNGWRHNDLLHEERRGLEGATKATAASKAEAGVRLYSDWVNRRIGGFHEIAAERRAMHMDMRHTLARHLRPRDPEVTCAQLAALEPPLTITVGQETRAFFRILSTQLHRCVPGSQLIELSGLGHAAPSRAPIVFNQTVASFLEKYDDNLAFKKYRGGIQR